jgi:hypothetical protein
MAAAYSGVDWGIWETPNPRGFLASIVNDPGATGGYSLHKYAANEDGYVLSHRNWGILYITDRCKENDGISYSILDPFFKYVQRKWIHQACLDLEILES